MKLSSAKGSVVRSTLKFLRSEFGDDVLARIVRAVPDDARASIEHAEPTDEVPYPSVLALWRAADAAIGVQDRAWNERAGAFAIQSTGVELYSGILKKAEPIQFLTQSVSLFRLYYRPGDMECVYEAAGTAVLRLVGFDPATPLFCQRQSGGLRCALTLAGGADPLVRHVRCALEGDAFCEWELSWKLAATTPPAPVLPTSRGRDA